MHPWQLARSTALPKHTTSRRLFFFDERLPESARNLRHVYAPVEKLGTVHEEAQGTTHCSSFCSTVLRLDDGRYHVHSPASA